MKVLVTGGTGYIGSHTCVELLNAGYDIVVFDNLSNSKIEMVDKIKEITKKDFKFYKADMLKYDEINQIFEENKDIKAVIHFAGLKAVGESVSKPLEYYDNNVTGTLNLLSIMKNHNVKKIIFSSSATVYGDPEVVPIKEDSPKHATNPYGQTKVMIEQILEDLVVSDGTWSVIALRYFNPIGAHESGLIGESPNGIPNNLMPYINQVALGKLDCLSVYGNDYDTVDGTGVRDYIHVVDLSQGHIKALERADKMEGFETYNLGTGTGYSVLEIINNFEKATGVKVNYKITDRRPGDIATCYADTTKAKEILGWSAKKNLEEMCKDGWRFTKNNM